jgi:PKD repeat protein
VTCDFRECDFDAAESDDPDGTIVDYEWDFDDGTTGIGVTESHTYATPGNYTVRLTVTDNHGETDDTTRTATPASAPPVAKFSIDCDTQACAFDGTGSFDPDGTIVTYEWDFGDGQSAVGPTPIHHFDAPGTYDVELTVTDNHGVTGVREKPAKARSARKVYLHDLKPRPVDRDGNEWMAKVVVKIRDTKGVPRAHAKIKAKMGNKNRACYTNDAGKCTIKMKVKDTRPKLPVEVTKVVWPGGYKQSANKDRDGDGNGATVTVWRPF